jgi:prepilin-type N-terminal cleavage/methylation domain-containing protein
MKTRRPPGARPSSPRAFTLQELLVVITIIALLAALSMGTFSMVQQQSARHRTTAILQAVINALERYKGDRGEYPEPANPARTGEIGGSTATIGGALMLYQAVTGDGNNAIKLGGSSGHNPSDGKITTDPTDPKNDESRFVINADFIPVKDATGAGYRAKVNATIVTADGYMIVDSFGHPFYYTHGSDPEAINTAGYDLWSVAQSRTAGSFSKSDKRDPTINAVWIKNW